MMVIAAFRYCLGRQSYIVGMCIDFLKQVWGQLDKNDKDIIMKEIAEELNRKPRIESKYLIDDWTTLLNWMAEKESG
jgi:hypothetical protein